MIFKVMSPNTVCMLIFPGKSDKPMRTGPYTLTKQLIFLPAITTIRTFIEGLLCA